ncbi:hypothetical protein ACF08M_27155 [Streptomyces sp. NPDC015032]
MTKPVSNRAVLLDSGGMDCTVTVYEIHFVLSFDYPTAYADDAKPGLSR